jgi:hypothetical protein
MILGEDEVRDLQEGVELEAGLVEEEEGEVLKKSKGGKRPVKEKEVGSVEVAGKRRGERRSKRRKTMGDAPTSTAPGLERKGSSFHTQTLTQFLGTSASRLGDDQDGELRVEDEAEVDDLPFPGNSPAPNKRPGSVRAGKGKGKAAAIPHTPSNKRIKVNIDEVPSSQPTPFTPMLGYSPIMPVRSPLTQKSTNVDAPPSTVETVSKLPRTLVIQDSYSMGSSEGFPSSSAEESPKKEEKTPSQPSKREPLSEIPVASLELGIGSTPTGETSSARKKRMFIEIPDSDDELESIGPTPVKVRSTQQTPTKREAAGGDFEIVRDPASGARSVRTGVSETPASLGRSDKENESPAIKVWDDETASEGEEPGSPTPRGTRSQTARSRDRASQVSPNTASQFWTASVEDASSVRQSGRPVDGVLAEREVPELAVDGGASHFHGTMGESTGKPRHATPQLEDSEETASEAEEEHVPTSILRKAASQRPPRSGQKKGQSTPILITSDSSASEEPGTPTPVVRRVQIELPPASTAEEVYKETPRRPHKSSPLYQRQTQARFQFYSQGLESQRVPLEVIRSLGPQTDRSDIIISIDSDIVDDIVKGARDHEFRNYRFPMQVCRCWIFTGRPADEIRYMATLGPAQEPGQIDSNSGLGNAEFNAGMSNYKFAHKLLQVYQLNNPVPLEDMADNGLGDGPPTKYRYIPPAIVGQLLANLRCALFEEEGEHDGDGNDGGVTTSQELEQQIRSDIIHSTQLMSAQSRRHQDEEDIISASQSPLQSRSKPGKADDTFTRPPVPAQRSSQRLRNRQSQHQPSPRLPSKPRQPTTAATSKPSTTIRPSQATTASDISIPSSSAASSPTKSSPAPGSASGSGSASASGPASVPRPPPPGSSEPSLPLPGMGVDDDNDSLLLPPLPPARLLELSSSQVGVLPPDSLLVDTGRVAPPPVRWDSDEDEEEEEYD